MACTIVCTSYNHDTCSYGRLRNSTLADPALNPKLFRLQQRETEAELFLWPPASCL